jgi:dienelactone hydrolase
MKKPFCIILIFIVAMAGCQTKTQQPEPSDFEKFLISQDELNLSFKYSDPERQLSFANYQGTYEEWKQATFQKFVELIAYKAPVQRSVRELRSMLHEGITYHALIMEAGAQLSIPAYLLVPSGNIRGYVMAIHGHGDVEAMIGLRDDYHHCFAMELAKQGFMVLCPEHRGFSTLGNLSADIPGDNLDYWVSRVNQFTLVTEGFLYGNTLIGETIADFVAWEEWWTRTYQVNRFEVAGISYGGDLALYYPLFSERVDKIFCSGSLGSFSGIFATSYNAPAHCIPGILKWMDRSDIAGLNAPRPILLHYGELDTPGPHNYSAAYNPSVGPSVRELKEIYKQSGAEEKVILKVTPEFHHEMDNQLLISFVSGTMN